MEERRCRFVQGNVKRLPISGGEWVDVHAELNAGETNDMNAELVTEMVAGEPVKLDPKKVGFHKVVAYVVGWSLLNRDGYPERLDESAVRALDQDTYLEILAAIDAHQVSVEAIRTARKNGQDGERGSPATSPSLAGAAGVSSGSAN